MTFLGSVKLDSAKRFTIIKEVAEILQVEQNDHIMFYLENGEIVIRKVLPMMGKGLRGLQEDFDDWVRKREIEISMIPDPEEQGAAMDQLKEDIREHEEHVAIMKENGMI